jgi:hypothetical protein
MAPRRSELPHRPSKPVYPDAINVARACGSESGRVAEVRPGESRFSAGHCLALRARPQLRNAIRDRKAFENFKEADPTHLPYVLDTHPIVADV